ncbi:MAG: hypothetical protein IJW92_01005 [Clostridia bacterium]|nr:hypothetical protein [Clostridia bacterium]
MESKFLTPEYRRSRNAYLLECMFEYFVTLLITDTFLANLLSHVGFSESEIGIISSIVSLAFIIQLFSLILARSTVSKKRIGILFDTVGQFFFLFLYVVPFLSLSDLWRKLLVLLCIGAGYVCKYLVSTIRYQWANSFVDPEKRASYSAVKEIVSLIGGMIFTVSVGAIYDAFVSSDNLIGGFLFIAILILVVNICNLICHLLIKKDDPPAENLPKKSFKAIFENTLQNKNFRKLLVVSILWNCAKYSVLGFVGTFKYDLVSSAFDIGVIMLVVQIINMLGSVIRIFVSKPFGRYSDKTSFAKGFYVAMFFIVAAYACMMLSTKQTWFFIVLYQILFEVGNAGVGQNSFNMMYSYVDSNYIAEAMALQNCVGGICGFLCSLVAGQLLSLIKGANPVLLGIELYAQQFLAILSILFCIACILFMKHKLMKEKVMKQ